MCIVVGDIMYSVVWVAGGVRRFGEKSRDDVRLASIHKLHP